MGEDTEFYLKKGFRVVAIEANPALYRVLAEKFRTQIRSGQLTLLDCAIATAEGPIDFYVNESVSVWSTIDPEWALRNDRMGAPSQRVQVTAQRFENVLRRHGVPHYLKIDIEGADMACVEALSALGQLPRFLSIEANKRSWRGLLREFSVLESLGYRKFKVINQRRVPHQLPPRPAREGRFTDHRFVLGSSGLFGEELPGRWLWKDEALLRYRLIYQHYRLLGDGTLTSRIVWRIPVLKDLLLPAWYDTHAAL